MGRVDGDGWCCRVQELPSVGRLASCRLLCSYVLMFLRNSVILPTLSYTSETWTWNAAQQSRIRAVEMSYMWGACGVSRWDRESNEEMYGRFGMSETAVGMDCGEVEWVKRSTLRWYGHKMTMNECDFTKKGI